MKSQIYPVLLILLVTSALNAQAQPRSAAEEAENLRLQLLDLQTQEENLRARAVQLDEALKPENIERSLAGVGSTRPEELREARRRQLQIERDGITSQLKILETSRMRLEASLRDADARPARRVGATVVLVEGGDDGDAALAARTDGGVLAQLVDAVLRHHAPGLREALAVVLDEADGSFHGVYVGVGQASRSSTTGQPAPRCVKRCRLSSPGPLSTCSTSARP